MTDTVCDILMKLEELKKQEADLMSKLTHLLVEEEKPIESTKSNIKTLNEITLDDLELPRDEFYMALKRSGIYTVQDMTTDTVSRCREVDFYEINNAILYYKPSPHDWWNLYQSLTSERFDLNLRIDIVNYEWTNVDYDMPTEWEYFNIEIGSPIIKRIYHIPQRAVNALWRQNIRVIADIYLLDDKSELKKMKDVGPKAWKCLHKLFIDLNDYSFDEKVFDK